MTKIISLIGEKKVIQFAIDAPFCLKTLTILMQIDGFKLHVSHVSRPYYGRLRQAPTTPGRIEKDLQQVKHLASILEDEYAALRSIKSGAPEPKPEETKFTKDGEQDVSMTEEQPAPTDEAENMEPEQDIEPEAFDRGSEAVERRIEKLTLELLSQQDGGEGDGSDSQYELNKVCVHFHYLLAHSSSGYPSFSFG